MKCVKLFSYSGLSSGIDCSRICFERINWSSRNFTTSVCVSQSTLHSSRSWGEKMLLSNVLFWCPWKRKPDIIPPGRHMYLCVSGKWGGCRKSEVFYCFQEDQKGTEKKSVKTFKKNIIQLKNYNRAGKTNSKLNNKQCTKMMLSTKIFFNKSEWLRSFLPLASHGSHLYSERLMRVNKTRVYWINCYFWCRFC